MATTFKNYESWCHYVRCKSNIRYYNDLRVIEVNVCILNFTLYNGYSTIALTHFGIRNLFNNRYSDGQDRQQLELIYIALYLLIWGEASNIRFMPECLCYIFHHVSCP